MNNSGFNIDWKHQKEGNTQYFTNSSPKTQMQLTFQNHFKFMKHLLGDNVKFKSCLEQGCGRGNLSMYFAAGGAKSCLMDLYYQNTMQAYENVTRVAGDMKDEVRMFEDDACNTKLKDGCVDFIFSVGLLEHIDDLADLFIDNRRILKKGGIFCHYVVPETKSIQDKQPYKLINKLLGLFRSKKPKIYRNNTAPHIYQTQAIVRGFKHVNYSWCMPIPLLSHSPSYPFSPLPGFLEKIVVWWQKKLIRKHGWLCDQEVGQGFYIWGYKE